MPIAKIVEYVVFFTLLVAAGFLVWEIISPLAGALALAIIIVTICYPLYEKILSVTYRNSRSIAAGLATLVVIFVVIMPLILISSVLIRELVSFYQTLSAGQELTIDKYTSTIEDLVRIYAPNFEFNLTEQIKQGTEWLVRNIGAIFAGTISTLFSIFIAIISSFYFFRDGRQFVNLLIKVSPLQDEDRIILSRLALAIRSVATGVLLVSLAQGAVASIGFAIFGIDRAVLWGAIAGVLSLIPGVGTSAIMIPGVIYLAMTSTAFNAIGLGIWTILTLAFIDHFLSPYLMSRGNNLHPFIVLISVLGGISTFGPMGFIIGPVIVTLFIVLLEIYNQYFLSQKAREEVKEK